MYSSARKKSAERLMVTSGTSISVASSARLRHRLAEHLRGRGQAHAREVAVLLGAHKRTAPRISRSRMAIFMPLPRVLVLVDRRETIVASGVSGASPGT